MKKNYEALSGINLELFYAVTIYEYDVRLQGQNSDKTIRYFQKNYNVSNWNSTESGYLEASFVIDELKVNLVLT
jgi:hypothetical protein